MNTLKRHWTKHKINSKIRQLEGEIARIAPRNQGTIYSGFLLIPSQETHSYRQGAEDERVYFLRHRINDLFDEKFALES